MKNVGAGAFKECGQLEAVQLNEGLKKLGEMEVVNGNVHTGQAFAGSVIRSIKLPSTLKRIEAETFWLCKRLTSVEIPKGVEHIGGGCFRGSCVEKVVLPNTLREIG